MIQLSNVDKSYQTGGTRHYVLRRITLTVQRGEFLTIMGPSGAGKSTLLGILGLLDSEWEGEYYFSGQAVHAMRQKERFDLHKRNVGFVFQRYHLLDQLTVAENLDIPLSHRDIKRADRQARVGDMLDRFEMVAKKDLLPSQLSGGQQQIVGIARAVISNPMLILADEPTGNLHSRQAGEVMELLKDLNRAGTTVVQVTHSEANAAYGDRVIRLHDGWLIDEMRNGEVRAPRVLTML
jgi:ABC-type lipoprotein export system ATPase subunit